MVCALPGVQEGQPVQRTGAQNIKQLGVETLVGVDGVLGVGDDHAVKRLLRKDGRIWLMPENDAYEPIDGTCAQIIGLVKAVVREY